MRLNELKDNKGARKARTRVGRGIGSGKGKTAGRGHKGAKSRSGYVVKGFEGGQMPIHMRLPKRGFKPRRRHDFAILNIGRLQQAIDAGKLDAKNLIDGDVLLAAGIVSRARDGVRLLAKGELRTKVKLRLAAASRAAVAAVEKAGGTLELIAPVKPAPEAAPDSSGDAS